ncbi:hypothetical protein ACSV9I_11760 [Rhizobium sp. G187]|uniref:hypothetical protein n=1 Tax=unclassified Rhizobium TaxID=2613769 RepID=UPI000B1ED116|nr:hypothetical protein [Rhizobium sp. AAP43]
MNRLIRLWRQNRLLVSGFVLVLGLVLFFAIRTALFVSYWNDPAHRNQPVEAWMTLGYVAHSWHVPVERLARDLDVAPPPRNAPRPSLERLAKERGQTFSDFRTELEAAIARLRAEKDKR